jgi:hypothetical protein
MSPDARMPQPKRTAPPKVKPVTVGDVRIEALHWGRSRGLGQNGGYIVAVDPASGRELWTLKVYDIAYDPKMEEDVQDLFIAKLAVAGDKLSVRDEQGRRFLVDLKRKTVAAQ